MELPQDALHVRLHRRFLDHEGLCDLGVGEPSCHRSEAAGNGPGAFSGPYVATGQALLVLVVYMTAFLALSGLLLRRRDVTEATT
jgi:hypothetical protein